MKKRPLLDAENEPTFSAALQEVRDQADELLALYDAMRDLEAKYRAKGNPVPAILLHLRQVFERDFGPVGDSEFDKLHLLPN